ncbi:MAG: hypothetical protein WBA68_13050 [Alteraurantiacibacter sp.]
MNPPTFQGEKTAKVFALGLGAQKAGTSWLHEMLAASSQADMGFTKEYHIWDGLTDPEFAVWKPTLTNHFARPTANPAWWFDRLRKLGGLRQRAALAASPDSYFDYFAGLLAQDGTTLTGDLTPAYGVLSEEVLRRIVDGFAARGVATKAVFVMRDPVERTWSALRMNKRAFDERNLMRHERASDEEEIRRFVDLPSYRARGDYAAVLTRMDAVFARENRLAALYENLFTAETVGAICAMLGIARVAIDAERRVNVTHKTGDLSDDTQRHIAGIFRPSYIACAERFGRDAIRAAWPSARFIFDS